MRVGEASHPDPRLFQGGTRVLRMIPRRTRRLSRHPIGMLSLAVSGATSVADATQLDVD